MARIEQSAPHIPNISDILLRMPPVLIRSNFYGDPQVIEDAINTYRKNEEEKAKKEGYAEAFTKIAKTIKKKIDNYISSLTEIADIVSSVTKEAFKDEELKITAIRTNFYFDTGRINILFIIDGDIEREVRFCSILNEVEKFILEEENLIAELFYINRRGKELDEESIKRDYPFVRKINS